MVIQSIVNGIKKEFYRIVRLIYIDPHAYFISDFPDGTTETILIDTFPIDMCFYLVMSQYFKKIKIKFGGEDIDLRLSFFLSSPSRTGKGQLIKVVEKIGKNLGLKIVRESYLEQASLMGTINSLAIEYNFKKNLKETDKNYKNPVIKGDLGTVDIIIIPEAKKLVKGRNEKDTEFILSTFQEALDCPGIIDKKLKDIYRINYDSTVSILATTYYLDDIPILFSEQGFFQRVPIYKQVYSFEQIKKMRHEIIEKFKKENTNINIDFETKKFANNIMKINNEEKYLELTDEAIKKLHEFNNVFFDMIKDRSGKDLEILMSFSQTIIHFIVKVGGINCCLRDDTKIITLDLIPVITMFNKYSQTLLNQIGFSQKKQTEEDVKLLSFLKIYKEYCLTENKMPNKTELAKFAQTKRIGFIKALEIIDKLLVGNYLIAKQGQKKELILFLNEGLDLKL